MLSKQNSFEEQESLTIELKHRMVVLKTLPFDTDINVDEILKIDYGNLLGEILTFPVLLNRIANLKAEMQNIVNEAKNDSEIFDAQLTEEKRKKIVNEGGKGTVSEVEAAIRMDARYKVKKNDYFAKIRNLDYLDSLYWAAQSKMTLLNKISDKIRPEEFSGELLQDAVNGVMIKITRKAIP
jgi:hypothetical protein